VTGACLRTGPLGNLRSPLTGNFKRHLEGSGKGASFFAGALLRGAPFWDPKDIGMRAQGTDITPWGVRSPGTLRDSCKGALETEHLSLWELC